MQALCVHILTCKEAMNSGCRLKQSAGTLRLVIRPDPIKTGDLKITQQESAKAERKPATPESQKIGQRLYDKQCAQCHGDNGEGSGNYPSLAGNRTVIMNSSVNLVRIILSGGFAPTTQGNPRPYGMPPFGHTLTDPEVAAVATYIRNAWGNNAGTVMPLQVQKSR